MSSHKAVLILRKRLNEPRMGHAGTLDPRAEGLLIVLVGKATKLFDRFRGYEKEYRADIEFGASTDTYDAAGKETGSFPVPDPFPVARLRNEVGSLKGEREQTPPPFSAVKVKGKRAYELARKGREPRVRSRRITVYRAELLSVQGKVASMRFCVSSGTYIRSFAHELGKKMGTGAFLKRLIRERIGEYSLEKAYPVSKIQWEDLVPLRSLSEHSILKS